MTKHEFIAFFQQRWEDEAADAFAQGLLREFSAASGEHCTRVPLNDRKLVPHAERSCDSCTIS